MGHWLMAPRSAAPRLPGGKGKVTMETQGASNLTALTGVCEGVAHALMRDMRSCATCATALVRSCAVRDLRDRATCLGCRLQAASLLPFRLVPSLPFFIFLYADPREP